MSIEYLAGETPDARAELLAKLRDLLPAAFPDGELDAGALCATLELTEPGEPSFSFNWPGIGQARRDARIPTTTTLVPDRGASINWEAARDVLIEGDNLQVLKILQAGYSGSAKLIYIDPPYNAGDTFTYNNDFAVPEPGYPRVTGQVDEPGTAATPRIDRAGRKHAPWLTMMFPRLALARCLLRRDGVILVSTDDNEVHNLRLLLDVIFGGANFIGSLVWDGGRKDDARLISVGHDYIIAYARDLQFLKDEDIQWRDRKPGLDEVYAKVNALRAKHAEDFYTIHQELLKWYRSLPEEHPSKAHEQFNYVDQRGIYFPDNLRNPGPQSNHASTFNVYRAHPSGWAYDSERMERLDRDGRIFHPEQAGQKLKIKSYLHEHEEWSPSSVFYKDRRSAAKALNHLIGREVFDYPKDIDVLGRMIHAITDDGDLIVDFFAGSGSTGHAVWKQNQADGKFRHWVLVQAPEVLDDKQKAWRKAISAGYATIFELAADRLRHAAQLVQQDTFDAPRPGFRIFRARPTNLVAEPRMIATESATGDQYVPSSSVWAEGEPVVQGADPLAVAWEAVLKASGTQLDARVIEHDINGVVVYVFISAGIPGGSDRILVSLGAFTLATADKLKLTDADTLILRGDKVDDATILALAPRLPSKLVLLGWMPGERQAPGAD